jgi:hypothetical protein
LNTGLICHVTLDSNVEARSFKFGGLSELIYWLVRSGSTGFHFPDKTVDEEERGLQKSPSELTARRSEISLAFKKCHPTIFVTWKAVENGERLMFHFCFVASTRKKISVSFKDGFEVALSFL